MMFFLLAVGLGVGILAYRAWAHHQSRSAILDSVLTDRERRIIAQSAPLLNKLPAQHRAALEGKIALFLNQVEFIGQDGLEVTDDMALSIAAQACLLVVNTDMWYTNLTTVLVYPGAFKSVQQDRTGYVTTEREIVRSGESWLRGPVILSWQHSEYGAKNTTDGHNVVLHEFAHQIDDLSGDTNGVPVLADGQRFEDWRRAIVDAFQRHVSDTERGRNTVMDAYGATAPEEFFAVAVETFFERPDALRSDMPDVYDQLATLFKLTPHRWT